MSFHTIKSIFQKTNFGLLFMRVSIGIMMAIYGYQKFLGGEKVLRAVGTNIKHIGIEVTNDSVLAYFFGIAAAGLELVGGILLIVGFFFRTAAFLLLLTMLVATATMYVVGEGDLTRYGYPLSMLLILFGFMWTGPGEISIQKD